MSVTDQGTYSQHFQKIRKESRDGYPSASTSVTPAPTASKKRKSRTAALEEEIEDDDEEEAPATSKSKRVKKENGKQPATEQE